MPALLKVTVYAYCIGECYFSKTNKLTSIFNVHVIDHELCDNIVKESTWQPLMDPCISTAGWTMLWQNLRSITLETHEKQLLRQWSKHWFVFTCEHLSIIMYCIVYVLLTLMCGSKQWRQLLRGLNLNFIFEFHISISQLSTTMCLMKLKRWKVVCYLSE